MYVKRYVVTRGAKRYAYLRLVESYRDDRGRPRHRIVANLGREDALKTSGQLEQLAGSFARLDPPLLGKGWGPGGVARQVRVLEAVTGEGVPLYVRPQPGDASELACLGASLERLASLLPPGLAVCADSVLGNGQTLLSADRAGLR